MTTAKSSGKQKAPSQAKQIEALAAVCQQQERQIAALIAFCNALAPLPGGAAQALARLNQSHAATAD